MIKNMMLCYMHIQQKRDVYPILEQCWPIVAGDSVGAKGPLIARQILQEYHLNWLNITNNNLEGLHPYLPSSRLESVSHYV